MGKILQKLKGGDLRSIGKADDVVKDILKHPTLFKEVFEGLLDDDPCVRMRSADALEKVSALHPEYLQPFKRRMINEISRIKQQEIRWHAAQMFAYLKINKKERNQIIEILIAYIDSSDKSKIVKTLSMQTLADLAEKDEGIRPAVISKLKSLIKTGSPAMINRGKKLLQKLKSEVKT